MTDLDQFIKMIEDGVIITDVTLFNATRVDLESQLEKGDKFDVLNEVFENYPKGWLEMKVELESQIKELQKELKTMEGNLTTSDIVLEIEHEEVVELQATHDLLFGVDFRNERDVERLKKSILDDKKELIKHSAVLDEIKRVLPKGLEKEIHLNSSLIKEILKKLEKD